MVSTSISEGPNNKGTESTINDVEAFIEKMWNQDILILYERARSISVDKDSPEPLSQALASSITNYEMLGKSEGDVFNGEHHFLIEPLGANKVIFTQSEKFTGSMVAQLESWLDTAVKTNFEAMNKALKERAENAA